MCLHSTFLFLKNRSRVLWRASCLCLIKKVLSHSAFLCVSMTISWQHMHFNPCFMIRQHYPFALCYLSHCVYLTLLFYHEHQRTLNLISSMDQLFTTQSDACIARQLSVNPSVTGCSIFPLCTLLYGNSWKKMLVLSKKCNVDTSPWFVKPHPLYDWWWHFFLLIWINWMQFNHWIKIQTDLFWLNLIFWRSIWMLLHLKYA